MTETMLVKRADIYSIKLKGDDHEQNGDRLALVVQCEAGNKNSPNVTVLPFTSSQGKRPLPTHVSIIPNEVNNLNENSIVLAECITTISKKKLKNYIGNLSEFEMKKVDTAMGIQLQINKDHKNGVFKNTEDYAFKPATVYNKVQGIIELENFIDEEGIEEGTKAYKRLTSSIQIQFEELENYCKQHGKDVKMYYRPRFLVDRGLKIGAV